VNVAVTLFAMSMVTAHAPRPEHAPLQPANVESVVGVAVSVIIIPCPIVSVQSVPHVMPLPLTLPVPVPSGTTVRT